MRLGSARIGAGSGSGSSRRLAGAAATLDPAREDAQAKLDLLKEEGIEEEEDDEAPQSPKMKHFSASGGEGQQDRMSAVDEGISECSDRIAQKVLQIQHKVKSPHFII